MRQTQNTRVCVTLKRKNAAAGIRLRRGCDATRFVFACFRLRHTSTRQARATRKFSPGFVSWLLRCEILLLLQGCAKLCKAVQDPGEGGLPEGIRICTPFEPVCAYLRLIAPICAFFPGKKRLFISLEDLAVLVNPNPRNQRLQTYWPKANRLDGYVKQKM
jgi:hypothetical protein